MVRSAAVVTTASGRAERRDVGVTVVGGAVDSVSAWNHRAAGEPVPLDHVDTDRRYAEASHREGERMRGQGHARSRVCPHVCGDGERRVSSHRAWRATTDRRVKDDREQCWRTTSSPCHRSCRTTATTPTGPSSRASDQARTRHEPHVGTEMAATHVTVSRTPTTAENIFTATVPTPTSASSAGATGSRPSSRSTAASEVLGIRGLGLPAWQWTADLGLQRWVRSERPASSLRNVTSRRTGWGLHWSSRRGRGFFDLGAADPPMVEGEHGEVSATSGACVRRNVPGDGRWPSRCSPSGRRIFALEKPAASKLHRRSSSVHGCRPWRGGRETVWPAGAPMAPTRVARGTVLTRYPRREPHGREPRRRADVGAEIHVRHGRDARSSRISGRSSRSTWSMRSLTMTSGESMRRPTAAAVVTSLARTLKPAARSSSAMPRPVTVSSSSTSNRSMSESSRCWNEGLSLLAEVRSARRAEPARRFNA